MWCQTVKLSSRKVVLCPVSPSVMVWDVPRLTLVVLPVLVAPQSELSRKKVALKPKKRLCYRVLGMHRPKRALQVLGLRGMPPSVRT